MQIFEPINKAELFLCMIKHGPGWVRYIITLRLPLIGYYAPRHPTPMSFSRVMGSNPHDIDTK